MLDDRVCAVLARLEAEDVAEREQNVPREQRGRQVARTTGQFLFALVAPQTDCEVLEIGGSRGYSTIWFAAGVRYLGGRVLSLEADPAKCEAWRRNIEDAGLDEVAQLIDHLPPLLPAQDTGSQVTEQKAGGGRNAVTYHLQLPPEYTHNRSSPVLIVLHGGGLMTLYAHNLRTTVQPGWWGD